MRKGKTPVAYLPREAEAPGVFVASLAHGGTARVNPTLLEHRLAPERMAPYRRVSGGDLSRAIALYEWNAEVAAAFWAVLGHVDVVVRNAMHEQLTVWSAVRFSEPRWYLDAGRVLTVEARQDIAAAGRRAIAGGAVLAGRP